MTVATQTNRISAVGSGATGQVVPFRFPISATSDVTVYKRVTATGVETTLAETTNYTIAITGDTGGALTTVTAIETTETIHIIRNTPLTQSLDLEQGGSFNAENIEDALDKNTKLSIENSDALERTLVFPATDPSSSFADMPNSVDRASKNLTFDSAGKPTASVSIEEGSVSFTTFGENMVGAANALAGKVVINLDHVFDVTDYGAVGDGVTDDTTAIQAAIAALVAAGRGTLFFPPGEYKIVPVNAGAIAITDLTDFRIVGQSAKILCDEILIESGNRGNKRMIYLINCSRFSISGIEFLFQVDFDSTVAVGTRNDHVINIYYDADFAHTNGDVRDFSVFNNTFEYIGPQLHDPDASKNSRLSIILINSESALSPARHVRDFTVYANIFKNCTGRVIYTFLAENGSIFGNTFEELGYMVHPDGDYETWALAVGIRVLGCANVAVTGNVLDGYSGDLVSEDGKGAVKFLSASRGSTTGVSENVTFTGNTIRPNKVAGDAFLIGRTYNTSFTGNVVLGDVTNGYASFRAVAYDDIGPTVDSLVNNNIIKDIPIIFDTENVEAYTNCIIEGNLIVKGANFSALYVNGAKTKLLFGRNYYTGTGWIDGRSTVCNDNQVVCNGNQIVYN